METVEQIRMKREAREAEAGRIAATLPPGHYHAFNNTVVNSDTYETVHVCENGTHWDACLIMLATTKESKSGEKA